MSTKQFSTYLTESNYDSMFKKIPANLLHGWDVAEQIRWAKQVLKKQDRITWFLKIVRLLILRTEENVKKYFPNEVQYYNTLRGVNVRNIRETLQHFYSLNLASIDRVVLNRQNYEDIRILFARYEEEWQRKNARLISAETIDSNDKEVVKVSNNMSWWLLPRASCSIEGKAMGHCGNAAAAEPGDRILSLRTKVTQGSRVFYEPHLTFILRKSGFFGEMKGYGNDKPSSKYHPAIVKLFQTKTLVRGLQGGGYAPEKNFAWDDFSSADKSAVLSRNPNFIGDVWETAPEVLLRQPDVLKNMFDDVYNTLDFTNNLSLSPDGTLQLQIYDDIWDFISECGGAGIAKWLRQWEDDQYDLYHISTQELMIFADDLPSDLATKLRKRFEVSEDVELSEAIEHHFDLRLELYQAMERGYMNGTYRNYVKTIIEVVEDITSPSSVLLCSLNSGHPVLNKENLWRDFVDAKCRTEIQFSDFAKFWKTYDRYDSALFKDVESRNYNIEVDFDWKAAEEYIRTEL